MKIAVLILGLILGAFLLVQSLLVTGLSGVAKDDNSVVAGAGGLLMAFVWLVAIALVFSVPLVSTALFGFGAVIGFGFASEYSSLEIWAVVSLVLAAFSFFAWRGKRRDDIRKRLDRDQMARLLAERAAPPPVTGWGPQP